MIYNFIIFLIVLLILFLYYQSEYNELEYITSDIDNEKYLVRKLPDSKEAANTISKIKKRIHTLIEHLNKKKNNKKLSKKKKKCIKLLAERYNPEQLFESAPSIHYTSYSVNKGEKIYLCLRSKKDNQIHKMNVIMYVVLHELAHVGSVSIGHNKEFYDNFNYLLEEAENIGIFKKSNSNKNIEYCGMDIREPFNG